MTDPHENLPVRAAGASLSEAAAAVVMLHGRGATAESILSLADVFDVEGIAYRAPQASNRTWYPNSFLAPLEANEPHLSSALRAVGRVLASLTSEGLEPARIVLLGFSQGACLASEFAARHPQRYGGLVLYSGGLIGNVQREGEPPHDKAFDYDGSLQETPAFVGCSDRDPHIPPERVDQTAHVLQQLGADVTKRIYAGMGHTINDDEIAFARRLLTRLGSS